MKNILFITSGSIGDAIISTSLLGWLADSHPQACFTIAAGVASAPLFEAFPALEKLLPIRKRTYNRHWFDLWNATRKTQWDLVVDLRGSLLSYLIRTRSRRIFQSPDKSLSKAQQLAALFNLPSPPPTRLWTNEAARAQATLLLPQKDKRYILLAPKTNSAAKDWPIERFAALARQLCADDIVFAILASQAQKESVRPLAEALEPGQMIDLSGRTDLPTALAVMERAALFIGNDSGLLHMAAAMGTPCIGLYGPSNHKTYAPQVPHVHLITTHDFAPGEPEKRHLSYMLPITVEQVNKLASHLLSGIGKKAAF